MKTMYSKKGFKEFGVAVGHGTDYTYFDKGYPVPEEATTYWFEDADEAAKTAHILVCTGHGKASQEIMARIIDQDIRLGDIWSGR